MKKLLLLFTFIAIVSLGRAQNPSFTVATNSVAITMGAQDYYSDTIVVSNIKTAGDLDLEWSLSNITVNQGWNYQMCDHESCILLVNLGTGQPNINTHDPSALKPGEDSYFKIILESGTSVESAVVEIKVWEKGNREMTEETIVYDVNNALSTNESAFAANVKVFPTQVDQTLYVAVEEGRLQRGTLHLMDMNGRVLTRKTVTPIEMTDLDVSELEAGMYLLRYEAGDHVVTRKFLKN